MAVNTSKDMAMNRPPKLGEDCLHRSPNAAAIAPTMDGLRHKQRYGNESASEAGRGQAIAPTMDGLRQTMDA